MLAAESVKMLPGLHSLVIMLVTAMDVAADDSPLSQLRQAIFFGYDKNVIPQEVCSSNIRETELLRARDVE